MLKVETDYRDLRLNNLNSPQFSHLKYLLFWPFYLAWFCALERLWPVSFYHPVHCGLDDSIPFCEYFLIPYLLWFVELFGIQLYTLLYDKESFKRFIRLLCVAFLGTLAIYMIYPTCQEMRIDSFPRDNVFSRFIGGLYSFDTNTNVCPSLHVAGAIAVMLCAWRAKGLDTAAWRIFFLVLTVLISLSTVFLKQHSVIDVAAAVPMAFIADMIVYRPWKSRRRK